jgi:hypothetical protein
MGGKAVSKGSVGMTGRSSGEMEKRGENAWNFCGAVLPGWSCLFRISRIHNEGQVGL